MQPVVNIPFDSHRYGPELLIDARPAEGEARSWYRQPHRFNFYEVLLVTRGRGWVQQDRQESSVEPGTAILTAPGCIRTLDLDADSSRFILCFQRLSLLLSSACLSRTPAAASETALGTFPRASAGSEMLAYPHYQVFSSRVGSEARRRRRSRGQGAPSSLAR